MSIQKSGVVGPRRAGVNVGMVAVDGWMRDKRGVVVYIEVDLTSSLSLCFNSFFTWLTNIQWKMRYLANNVPETAP